MDLFNDFIKCRETGDNVAGMRFIANTAAAFNPEGVGRAATPEEIGKMLNAIHKRPAVKEKKAPKTAKRK